MTHISVFLSCSTKFYLPTTSFFFPSNGTKTSLSKSPKLAIAKIAQKLKSPNFFFWGGLFWG
jgi:hypothetical protein